MRNCLPRVSLYMLSLLTVVALCRAQSDDVDPPPLPPALYIQQQLDTLGYYQLPPGETVIDRPLRLTRFQRLTGCGPVSVLRFAPSAREQQVAIYFGALDAPNYACYLDHLSILGGALQCERFGQHCGIDRVWISRAPGDGLRVQGIGDKMAFRDVVVWECSGAGIAVRCHIANNGLIFDHCSASNNAGVGLLLEASTHNASLSSTVIRDCTFQGNGGPMIRSQVLVAGYVHHANFENVWIEGATPVGLRTEARSFGDLTRRPTSVRVAGASEISLHPIAIEYAAALTPVIDSLAMSASPPLLPRIVWRARQAGDTSIIAQPPAGLLRITPPGRIFSEDVR